MQLVSHLFLLFYNMNMNLYKSMHKIALIVYTFLRNAERIVEKKEKHNCWNNETQLRRVMKEDNDIIEITLGQTSNLV